MADQGNIRLAVLTSGGDSAGMNGVVRAVVKAGILKCASSPSTLFPDPEEPFIEAVKHISFVRATKA